MTDCYRCHYYRARVNKCNKRHVHLPKIQCKDYREACFEDKPTVDNLKLLVDDLKKMFMDALKDVTKLAKKVNNLDSILTNIMIRVSNLELEVLP